MIIEQIYTNCLAQASYFISSEGEAAIIDPIRDYEPYLEMAKKENVEIKYIFETHFHADFVSGHLDLAAKTNSKIVFGPNAETAYKATIASDNQVFSIGKLKIKVLHTPGHTMESSCYLLIDENGNDKALFTGDTLFVGDVGRPDLAVNDKLNSSDLAACLFDSLQEKIKPLNDDVIVYPGHGAGSSCGKNLGKERYSTIAEQKTKNYALSDIKKEEFIKKLISDIPAAPKYFPLDAAINKKGYDSLDKIFKKSFNPLSIDEFKLKTDNSVLLDCRIPDKFEKGFIPGSINIGLNGQFAIWAASLLDFDKDIILLADNKDEIKTAITRLARVGISSVIGFLEDGFPNWEQNGLDKEFIESKYWKDISNDSTFIDLRTESERSNGYIKDSVHIPLNEIEKGIKRLDRQKTYYLYCAGGYRSMIAASILKKNQFKNITNIYGGFSVLEKENERIIVPN